MDMYSINQLLPVLTGFGGTVALILAFNPLARRLAWVDKPDNIRKLHGDAIPLTGGVAMMLAFAASVVWFDHCRGICSHRWLLGAMGIMTLVGLWDDKYHLSPRFRIALQTGVGYLLALAAGLGMNDFGNILGLGDVVLPQFAGLFFTVFCVVGAMNAINMIDGVDGLAGGVSLAALLWMVYLTSRLNMPETTVLLALIGCVAGYLVFNMRHPFRRKAAVFMGDSGSMMLGIALAWLLISLSQHNPAETARPPVPPVLGLWLVALPLLDTLSLMLKRRLNGKSPFRASRDHLHHILLDAGLSERCTTYFITLAAIALGGVAVAGWQLGLPEAALFAGFLLLAAGYYYLVHHSGRLPGCVRLLACKPDTVAKL